MWYKQISTHLNPDRTTSRAMKILNADVLCFQRPWWRHQMETFSALLGLCAGNSLVTGEFPSQKPVTRSFDVFFDLGLNKRLSKQSRRWYFETPSCSLWRHCIVSTDYHYPQCWYWRSCTAAEQRSNGLIFMFLIIQRCYFMMLSLSLICYYLLLCGALNWHTAVNIRACLTTCRFKIWRAVEMSVYIENVSVSMSVFACACVFCSFNSYLTMWGWNAQLEKILLEKYCKYLSDYNWCESLNSNRKPAETLGWFTHL